MASGGKLICWNEILLCCALKNWGKHEQLQFIWYPDRDSKEAPPEYEPEALPPAVTCSVVDEMDWRIARMEEMGNAYKILVGDP